MTNGQPETDRTILYIQVIVRSIIALTIVGAGVFALVTGRQIPPEAWKLAAIILGSIYGIDIIAKWKLHTAPNSDPEELSPLRKK